MKKSLCTAVLSLSMLLAGCTAPSKSLSFKEGTYTGSGNGRNGEIKVSVVLTKDKIQSVEVTEQTETKEIAESALNKIPEEIVSSQSLAVDTVSGATLTSNGIIEAVKDALQQAGADVDALSNKQTSSSSEVEETTADIVVVGAGAAGSAAALKAAQSGKYVILLEKTESAMGAGTLAGGMFAADSRLQQAQGKTVDKGWVYDQYYTASHGYMNSLLVHKIIDEAGNTVNWLLDNNMELNLVDAGTGGAYNHIGMPATLHGYNEGGKVAITKLVKEFENAGGEVRWSTPAYELQADENGVHTVLAKKSDGSTLKISTSAVIIATGGYGGNSEMMKEYIGDEYTSGEVLQNTGDGIKMAYSVGAAKAGLGVTQYFWQTFTPEEMGKLTSTLKEKWFSLADLSMFPMLRVNGNGQRYSDETKVTSFAEHGAELAMQPGQYEYMIIDQATLDKIAENGTYILEDHYAKWIGNEQFYMEFNEPNSTDQLYAQQHTPIDYTEIFNQVLDSGVVFKADTLEGLAQQLGVSQENLQASVDQYNHAIETEVDDLYNANTSRLVPVVQGPFYAVKYVARNLGTLGGIRINENMQVLDEQANIIKGLYAAGADAGGMYGKSYVDFEGGTLGFAYTSGKLAGEQAVEDLK